MIEAAQSLHGAWRSEVRRRGRFGEKEQDPSFSLRAAPGNAAGSPGGLPRPGSHRSGLADFPHPVRNVADSQRRETLPRWLPVAVTLTGLQGSESPPVSRPRLDDALSPSLPRVLVGQVPLSPRYYGTLRLLRALPTRLLGFASAVPPLAFAASLPPARTLAGGQGPLRLGRPTKADRIRRRRTGLPGSGGTLRQLCPGLRPRRDRHARPLRRADVAPRHANGEGYPPRGVISGLDVRASLLAVYASWGGSPHHCTQDSLPAAGQALPGGIAYPQGSDERFQVSPTSFLLSQASPGAIALSPPVNPLQHDFGNRRVLRLIRGKEWIPCRSRRQPTTLFHVL
jgi:hypothetical protein